MKISIVTVCRNSEKSLARTIESVLAQTHPDWEHVIVDGASQDGTVELVKSYGQDYAGRLKLISEPDKGIYDAMNKGVGLCSGGLIGVINSDDWYEPGALQSAAEAAEAHPAADIVYGLVRIVSADGAEAGVERWSHKRLEERTICHQACFVKASAFMRVGLFDLSYRLCADYDFLLRAKAAGCPFLPIDAILANFSSGGASSDWKERELENLRVRKARRIIQPWKAALSWLKIQLKAVIS